VLDRGKSPWHLFVQWKKGDPAMKRRMRAPSPALVVAVVALFVALGGTTYAATSLGKNSVGTAQLKKNAVTAQKIKNGAVTAQKISRATVAALRAGSGSILNFDANATASPSPTTLGTALGDTWAAECTLNSGHAELAIFLKTSDGSWHWEIGQEIGGSGAATVNAFDSNIVAGTLSTFLQVGAVHGGTAPTDFELADQGVQLAPVGGFLSLHLAVLDTTAPAHTCHMTVDAIPEKVTGTLALRHSGATRRSTAQIFGNR
jgi:hypothetical protein